MALRLLLPRLARVVRPGRARLPHEGMLLPEVYLMPCRLKSAIAQHDEQPAACASSDCIATVFSRFDTDGSGGICAEELHDAFHELGVRLTRAGSDAVFACIDTNKDDKLSLEEFSEAAGKAAQDAAANPLFSTARLLLSTKMGVRRLERSLSKDPLPPPPIA